MKKNVRVRFAPSPTGYLHVGGLRTALYNYLFAKQNSGTFVLRIEDTDRNRFVEGAAEKLMESLKWSGLFYDEGPDIGGDYGPYVQSDRLEIYHNHIKNLVKENKAYYCFCDAERIEKLREEALSKKLQPKYDKHCLHLTKEETEANLRAGKPHVVRLNVEQNKRIIVDDLVRGRVEFDSNTVDDQILLKSDGFPTYHLANVVDDSLMKISHVIRGEEWLPSTPKHVILYEYLGKDIPYFAHLPLLLNPDKSKLSKRQGDVAVEDYRDKGYLKEAIINFVALLGWSTVDNRDLFSLEELVEYFSLERVHKSGAVFNIEKLNWLNAEHLRRKDVKELIIELKKILDRKGIDHSFYNDDQLGKIITSMLERITFLYEIPENASYYFSEPEKFDDPIILKKWKNESNDFILKYAELLEEIENPLHDDYENLLAKTAEILEVGKGKLMFPLRVALTGASGGPGLYEIMEIIGKEKTILRIRKATEIIKV